MKKILIAIVAIMILACGSAQAVSRWGVIAGANINKMSFNQKLFAVDPAVGFSAGVIGELMIPGVGFGVDASLLYAMTNAKLHLGDKPVWANDGYGTETMHMHYIEIPLNLKFKYTNLDGIENTIAPIAFAGPTFSINAHNSCGAMKSKALAVGLHFGIGCELIRKINVQASYNIGVTESVQSRKLSEVSGKNRYWNLTVAYMF